MKANLEYLFKKNFISLDVIKVLNEKFDEIKSKKIYKSVNDSIVELTAKQTHLEPVFDELNLKIKDYFKEKVGLPKLKLTKLWLASSVYKDSNPSKLPYIPHFDKLRYFKAMIYLHPVTESHGPIYFGRAKDPADIERRRKKLPSDYKIYGLNTIDKSDLMEAMHPIIGNAGDIIFFDTNAPHKAGVLTKGHVRRVLRFDFELSGLNKKQSLISRVLKKILKYE